MFTVIMAWPGRELLILRAVLTPLPKRRIKLTCYVLPLASTGSLHAVPSDQVAGCYVATVQYTRTCHMLLSTWAENVTPSKLRRHLSKKQPKQAIHTMHIHTGRSQPGRLGFFTFRTQGAK